MRRVAGEVSVEPLGGDLLAIAECHALDASVFPHPSVPGVVAGAPAVWVAKRRGRVVGFVATHATDTIREVRGIAVAASERGTGVGRTLLRTAIEASRGLRAITLQVSTANLAAITLYESEGFFVLRTLDGYYSPLAFRNGGDAYAMYRPCY